MPLVLPLLWLWLGRQECKSSPQESTVSPLVQHTSPIIVGALVGQPTDKMPALYAALVGKADKQVNHG